MFWIISIREFNTIFDSQKIQSKEKKIKNGFLKFNFIIKNIKEYQIWLKLIRKWCIFKLFNPYIIEKK